MELNYIEQGHEVEGHDILILPGSKSTTSDLLFLMKRGFFQAIQSFTGLVAGICGGYQMLGRRVSDPHGIESHVREAEGLGLLDVETVMRPHKETHQAEGRLLLAGSLVAPGCSGPLFGYEIHMGRSTLGAGARPFLQLSRRSGSDTEISDGAVSLDGRIFGTYLHGLFDNHSFRRAFLNRVRKAKGMPTVAADSRRPDPFDQLAEHLERHVDMERLLRICGVE